MDIKPNQLYEDHLGRGVVLTVVAGWVMFSRGKDLKPDLFSTTDFRNRFAPTEPDRAVRPSRNRHA